MPVWLSKAIEYLVPLVAVALSYFFGRLQNYNTSKSTALQTRYEAFYVPFITLLYCGRLDCQPYSSLDFEARAKYFDLVMHNLRYLGLDTQSCVMDFYTAFLDHLDAESDGSDTGSSAHQLDFIFHKLRCSVLSEAKDICRSLHLPDITRAFSTSCQCPDSGSRQTPVPIDNSTTCRDQ